MTPLERARASADVMWATDGASQWIGMRIDAVAAGAATLGLTIKEQHCNGFGMCHGGITFALADSAFAFACNSRNVKTVAQHNVISYTAPVQLGDHLTAHATEVSLTGRSGIYDVVVQDQNNKVVAQFRGMSRALGTPLFAEKAE